MSEYVGTIAAAGEHEVYFLHPPDPHPDVFGIFTDHPMALEPGAEAEPGPVNYHPGPDFAPREPEVGS
jgi:hypothetical protein